MLEKLFERVGVAAGLMLVVTIFVPMLIIGHGTELAGRAITPWRKIFLSIYVILAIPPTIGIPLSSVCAYQAWAVELMAWSKFDDGYSRFSHNGKVLIKKSNIYFTNIEEIKESELNYHVHKGATLPTDEELKDWYTGKHSWAKDMGNLWTLVALNLALILPLVILILANRWVDWVTRKEEKTEEPSKDDMAA